MASRIGPLAFHIVSIVIRGSTCISVYIRDNFWTCSKLNHGSNNSSTSLLNHIRTYWSVVVRIKTVLISTYSQTQSNHIIRHILVFLGPDLSSWRFMRHSLLWRHSECELSRQTQVFTDRLSYQVCVAPWQFILIHIRLFLFVLTLTCTTANRCSSAVHTTWHVSFRIKPCDFRIKP